MSTAPNYPHISVDSNGEARIARTRYKLLHLAVEHYHYGWSAEELLRQHPDLRPAEVHAALAWFYDHHDQVCEQMEADRERAQAFRLPSSLSREELLARTKDSA